jgi:hypothetical protein
MDSENTTIHRNITKNNISDLFFSSLNMNALQDGIRNRVYNETEQKISRQSDIDLLIIMRSIYFTYAQNRPDDIVQQVRELNIRVLDETVPRVVSEVRTNLIYQKDICTLPVPMERSQNMSSAGTKTLFTREL